MNRCVIIGAAAINNYEKLRYYLQPDDYIVVCDGGLNHVAALGVQPHLIIGDFDSHSRPENMLFPEAEIIQLPCEKDDTDVFFAAKEAYRRGYKDFCLFGVIGQRFDHSLVNISVLMYLNQNGATAKLYDDYSEMKLVVENVSPVMVTEEYSYFSLMCIDGTASGVTIKNAKYPLENAELTTAYQFGISNEVLPNKKAEVSLKKGILLLIQVW